MKVVFVPLYRMAANYVVSFGRRWSVLEQLILLELSFHRRTALELAGLVNLPDRLVVEALVNLLRASWIEVRSTEAGSVFTATSAGKRRVAEENLPVELQRRIKWISLCVDRITGSWFRSDQLNLVYERDLPPKAHIIGSLSHTYDPNDPNIRELLPLSLDESLEPIPLNFRTPSRPFARIQVAFGKIESGLPDDAPLSLREAVLTASCDAGSEITPSRTFQTGPSFIGMRENITDSSVVVGGAEHRDLIIECLESAGSHIIIHSCFLSPATVEFLLPHFEKAAKRKVKIDLLWGLHADPEDPASRRPVSDSERVLGRLDPKLRSRVQLSSISSGSHAKVIQYDDAKSRNWITVLSSCNFLSSNFDWVETSFRSANQALARRVLGNLIYSQLPASGSWETMARRLHRSWASIRTHQHISELDGTHSIRLLSDRDHYAAVTHARDVAKTNITIGCDLYGLSAEISVLVPMERAAQLGKKVQLAFSRSSKILVAEGMQPDVKTLLRRGISLEQVPRLHGKFLVWDDEGLCLSSFNWMSTVGQEARSRGAEIGIMIEGPGLRELFRRKLQSAAKVDLGTSDVLNSYLAY